jgi:hypothetical protein
MFSFRFVTQTNESLRQLLNQHWRHVVRFFVGPFSKRVLSLKLVRYCAHD